MQLARWVAFFISIAAVASGCSSSKESEDQPSGATCPTGSTSTLTYDNFGSAFFTSYCLECHSSTKTGGARNDAPTDVNFDSLADIQLHSEQIDIEAAASPKRTNTSMPPETEAKQPNSDERLKLGEWLACGAL